MMAPKIWLSALVDVIKTIADKKYQEKVWLGKIPGQVSSWDEVICQFFDDLDADGFINGPWREAGLTEIQHKKLVIFRNILEENSNLWGDYPDPGTILASSEWEKVRQFAKDFLSQINVT